MDVWLQTQTGEDDWFRLVRDRQQATVMTQNKALEALGGARRDYPQCEWEIEPVCERGEFVVHGQKQ